MYHDNHDDTDTVMVGIASAVSPRVEEIDEQMQALCLVLVSNGPAKGYNGRFSYCCRPIGQTPAEEPGAGGAVCIPSPSPANIPPGGPRT